MTFVPATDLPYPALAALFQRGFAGYVVPMHPTPEALEARHRVEHVDLFASRVALLDGAPIGLATIARRGRRSRLAAMGVVAEARGTGAAQALLDRVIEDARARGDREMVLECIASNERALRLYRRAGFTELRRLVGWRCAAVEPVAKSAPRLREVDPVELGHALARADDGSLSWQLAPASLVGVTAPMRGWTIDGSALVVGSVLDREISLRALFTLPDRRRRGHASRLVRALAADFAPRSLVIPPMVPAGLGRELADHLGAVPHELEQLEMSLVLDA
ncbi:MAG: GNAT family N-acetyltransferase [Kofleriaceae bacterium]